MNRRRFLLTSLASALAGPLGAEGQKAGKVHRLAIVYAAGSVAEMTEARDPLLRVLFPELRRLAYVEGQNLVVERWSGEGRREGYRDVAREVVGRKPDVVFAGSGRMAEAFRAITTTVPIVTITSDPVALGLAASLPRPGGNITGFTVDAGIEVVGKRLEILKEVVPGASRVAFLASRGAWEGTWGRVMREAAARAGAMTIAATLNDPIQAVEYRRAFAEMARERAELLVVTDHAEGFANRGLIVELAAQSRLPAIYAYRGSSKRAGSWPMPSNRWTWELATLSPCTSSCRSSDASLAPGKARPSTREGRRALLCRRDGTLGRNPRLASVLAPVC